MTNYASLVVTFATHLKYGMSDMFMLHHKDVFSDHHLSFKMQLPICFSAFWTSSVLNVVLMKCIG